MTDRFLEHCPVEALHALANLEFENGRRNKTASGKSGNRIALNENFWTEFGEANGITNRSWKQIYNSWYNINRSMTKDPEIRKQQLRCK